MRILKHALSLIFALLLSSGAVAFAQQGDHSIIVEVKGDAGRPLKHACVTLVPRDGEIVFRKADGRGQVRVKGLRPGNYRVIVKVDGYEAQKREITVGSETEAVAFLMQPRVNR
jgi:Carboxypeptidase regulatory-like domain